MAHRVRVATISAPPAIPLAIRSFCLPPGLTLSLPPPAVLVTESYGESNSIAHAPLPGFLGKFLRHESASERLLRDKKAARIVGVPAYRRIPTHAVARRGAAT